MFWYLFQLEGKVIASLYRNMHATLSLDCVLE